ncbi:hypothetical protein QFC19_008550 [Naganishia cerealis]|uniref:Uncharacterized protein n=1 Tax=Naganishia cerealis TaxID=610337 RepID=A0ACC2V1R3_9TREE|nr:hypothetical protein QFC19_008550 [Naganishia cerealis]
MFYLAAAVSDFFLPQDRVAEHKIQSTKGNLTLEMDQVPKVLRPLVKEWIPEAFIVSFKVGHCAPWVGGSHTNFPYSQQLETEQALLVPKAQKALERYGHQVVVGNDLHKRKHEVVLVELDSPLAEERGEEEMQQNGFKETWLRLLDLQEEKRSEGARKEQLEALEIEEMIVQHLVARHDQWLRE